MANKEEGDNARSAHFVEMVVRTLRHEVGDLLQSVYSAVAILQERLPDRLGVERTVLSDLRSRAEMCKHELDAVHDLVCPLTLNADWLELSELATGLAAKCSLRCSGVQIICEAPHTVKIWGDGRRLSQLGAMLLTSLCQEARSKIVLHIGPSANAEQAEWSFQHDGPSADAEQLSWLTAPFRTTRHARLGLGLALAQRVMQLHGGNVATEASKEGFNLTLFLPLRPLQAATKRTNGEE
jgi:light-regulated signal transduction histidine kinase (bacteriophytochrome)